MLLKICLISALVVSLEAANWLINENDDFMEGWKTGGQEDLEVDRVMIQAAASATAESPQMDVWRAEERQGWRYDCCELDELDHGSECSLKVGYKNCRKHGEFYKCRISKKSRSGCVLKEMTKKEKADQKKEKAEREWVKTCCISGYVPRLDKRTNPDWMCGDRYRSSTPRSNIEEKCMLRVCIKPEDGKCFSQLKTDYYKND